MILNYFQKSKENERLPMAICPPVVELLARI